MASKVDSDGEDAYIGVYRESQVDAPGKIRLLCPCGRYVSNTYKWKHGATGDESAEQNIYFASLGLHSHAAGKHGEENADEHVNKARSAVGL